MIDNQQYKEESCREGYDGVLSTNVMFALFRVDFVGSAEKCEGSCACSGPPNTVIPELWSQKLPELFGRTKTKLLPLFRVQDIRT